MKKTQTKDALRNIKKQWVSFLSIVVIAFLGVGSFLSIGYASKAISVNSNDFYDSVNFRNIEVISSKLLSPEDLDAIKRLDGVKDVEQVWQAGADVYTGEGMERIYFITYGERISKPHVIDGRLPEELNECAVEKGLAEKRGWKIGDVLDDISMIDSAGQYFLSGEFTITGIVLHPDHISTLLEETKYILVNKKAFDADAMYNCSPKAEITLDESFGKDRFYAPHGEKTAALVETIEELAEVRGPLRDAWIQEEANKQLDETAKMLQKMYEERIAEDPGNAETEESFKNALADIEEQRKNIAEMAPCRWIVFDESGNPGFVQVQAVSRNLASMQSMFAMLFIVLSALVVFATVSKIIEEQSIQVGTTKALGFRSGEILLKYLIFGLLATLIGVVLGIIASRFVLEGIALKGYNNYIAANITKPYFDLVPTLIVLVAAILLAAAAVVTACFRLIRSPAVKLMQPPVPGARKTSGKGKSRLSLYSRLILRNIRTDWKRVTVTVVSIMGCCALIVIGFSLRFAVVGCREKQYSQIIDYDAELLCNPFYMEDFKSMLEQAGAECRPVYNSYIITRVSDTYTAKLYCGDIEEISEVLHLNDWKSGEKLGATDDGIYIYQRMAEIYGLDVGSEFEVLDNLSDSGKVKVAGIFDNYIDMPVVMSSECYKKVFGSECNPNMLLVNYNRMKTDELIPELEKESGLIQLKEMGADRSRFDKAMSTINAVVGLFVVMAAFMAAVVLMNLTNIYILQKKRELTVMRANGFTMKEVIWYLLRETIAVTTAGIVLGIACGSAMGYRIIRSLEQSITKFDRSVSIKAWIIGAGITILFAAIVNIVAMRRLKKLKLTDATL